MPRTGLYLQQMGFQTSFEIDPCPTFHSEGSGFNKISYVSLMLCFFNHLKFSTPNLVGSGIRIQDILCIRILEKLHVSAICSKSDRKFGTKTEKERESCI